MMSKRGYELVIFVMAVFIVSQQLLMGNYGELNDRLQDALSKCAGITKVK